MYLAYSTNMLSEPISFADYRSQLGDNPNAVHSQAFKQSTDNEYLTKAETEIIFKNAEKALKNFKPPEIEGG